MIARRRLPVLTAAIVGCLLLSTGAPRAEPEDKERAGTFNVVLENDLFADFDQHYTNGIKLAWTSDPSALPAWLVESAHAFPLFPEDAAVRASYALGQNMYTPADITNPTPPPTDRPYAGWLYGSVGLIAETGTQLDQIQLTAGIVGPLSLAEQTQKFVHVLTGSDRPEGWDTQLSNEPGIMLAYRRSWRVMRWQSEAGFGMDATPHAGATLGNVFTYGSAGLTLRFGYYRPEDDYGPVRIQPGTPGSGFFTPKEGIAWYLFAGVEGRAVGRNIFLDGNTWHDSRSVDKKVLVGDAQFGFAVTWGRTRLAYTHVFRTPEFDGQGGPDVFGAISLSTLF
ncbi:MAG: hypothetical protein CMM50_18915 [Rhodospirillaceae bacterium]|nr:hypothetical protein [Rhodospirillaceae bacterium]|tara:strand:+ start:106 stop:1119 length:1014 start_codon:yes stop_codon:yes gene_type:complete